MIAGLGYDGVELAVRDPKLVNADHLEHLLARYALVVPAIGTGQAWGEEGLSFTDPDERIREAAIRRIQSHIPLAARLGALIIIGLIRGTLRPGVDHALAWAWLVGAVKACGAAARGQDVRVALEPISRKETALLNNVAQGMQLVEQVGLDNVGLLLDTYHMSVEEAEIGASIRACGRHVFHFHVADSNRQHPGSGRLDFKSILKTLGETGYDGWISGEFLPLPTADVAAKNCISYLRGIMA